MFIPVATVPPRLESFARNIARTYACNDWPEEELYSIMADAIRVGTRTAKKYADASCVELNQDELEAEARRKLIELFQGRPAEGRRKAKEPILNRISKQVQAKLTSGRFAKCLDLASALQSDRRKQLFAFLSTCFNNHTRGLVHRHRFTAKRTGSKVPARNSPELARWVRDQQKPEISLDADPELRSRREFHVRQSAPDQMAEMDEDLADLLNPLEFIVWQQMTAPNEAAWLLAQIDSWRGREPGEIKITFEHYAAGVGLSATEFTRVGEVVMRKFREYQQHGRMVGVAKLPPVSAALRTRLTPVEFLVYQQLVHPNARARQLAQVENCTAPTGEHLALAVGLSPELFSDLVLSVKQKLVPAASMETTSPAIAALETIFEVQVPRSVEPMVVRRLFTLAARSRVERVTPDVADLLRTVGAEAPELNSQGNLTCFGVLYSRNHHVCSACQARKACQAKAENFGLDRVVLHPSLLTARDVRTAQVIDSAAQTMTAAPGSEREEEVCTFLEHNFRRVAAGRKINYLHRSAERSRLIVSVIRESGRFQLRFCSPSPALRARLVEDFAPDELSAREVCTMVEQHANTLFAEAVAPMSVDAIPAPQLHDLLFKGARRLMLDLLDGLRIYPLKK